MVILCMDVKPGMEVACLTDVGRLRENNEDSCLYWEPQDKAEFLRKGRLAVIAEQSEVRAGQNEVRSGQMMEAIQRLARIADIHETRIRQLE